MGISTRREEVASRKVQFIFGQQHLNAQHKQNNMSIANSCKDNGTTSRFTPFAGHRDAEVTLASIAKRYYWNYMPSEIKQFCQSCTKCQIFNYASIKNRAPLSSIIVTRPWQLVGFDFMGPFNSTKRGKKYIIIAIDHYTKFVEGAATASFDAETTAEFAFNNIVCRYGMIESVLSDQDVNFESHLYKHLWELCGVEKKRTSTYHAPGNGITERTNKTIKPNLAKLIDGKIDDWDLYFPMAISAYNNSHHETIGMWQTFC